MLCEICIHTVVQVILNGKISCCMGLIISNRMLSGHLNKICFSDSVLSLDPLSYRRPEGQKPGGALTYMPSTGMCRSKDPPFLPDSCL